MIYESSLCRTIEWIDNNLDIFINRRDVFKGGYLENLKHSSELALVCCLLIRNNTFKDWATSTLGKLWENTFLHGEKFSEILIARPDMISALSTYINFHESGFENPKVIKWCRYIAEAPWLRALPMPIWRLLDILNSLDRVGLRHFNLADLDHCWITSSPPINFISTEISYAITHEIFYMSDFGRARNRIPSTTMKYLQISLPIWQQYFFHIRDLDLLSEFMLCQYFTTRELNKNLAECSNSFQKYDGSFPGPDRVRKHHAFEQDCIDYFRADYHTTLVMCILLSCCSISNNTFEF